MPRSGNEPPRQPQRDLLRRPGERQHRFGPAISHATQPTTTLDRIGPPSHRLVNSVVVDLQGNRAGAREARLADRVAAVTLATAAPPFSPLSRAKDATPRTASLSKT